ncbi:tRNA (adenosine(37)-N6)-dimethylallyltransferase MiaA [Psittacicella gerlachiana]|uniref:tRNA dimethylallyltransferase n=1 Tax=Psittacicella gerlachiana TaxID=2028574 RepID=A0A3A1YGM2_9GAMM|nr:tRNA (adenosine(37)-N6)-dimethylallyltransferase MiaA [Psittacicella gerlachiana]RIY36741.1 tRNA (adenosine(37)-N6)-dimethylallyltransferase MiaA [Psittacicella gerlachiana]
MTLPVITLMGATASGKTRLAMALYKKNPEKYDLINVDSALIYRDMTIGTAKPSPEELAQAPHALVDILDPAQSYSVGQFQKDVDQLIKKSHQQGKIPLLVGGTMMYYRSLLGQLDQLPSSTEESRAWVNELFATKGNLECHQMLKEIDPAAFSRLHPNDSQRVGRILELYYLTGKSMSEISNNNSAENKHLSPLEKELRMRRINKKLFNTPHYNLEDYYTDFAQLTPDLCLANKNSQGLYEYHDVKGTTLYSKYNLLQFAMYNQDRTALHADINNRLKQMVADGIVAEVEKLYQRGDLNRDMPSVRCVGYRQLWDYFDGEVTLEQALENVAAATRQLAKRQITWLRSWPLPFTQIPTNIPVEQQIEIIEKVLNFALEQEDSLCQKP